MSTGQKAVVNSIGSLVVFLAQWLISVFLVRVSGYADAGIFSLAMSVSNIFSFFANYNIRNYQISDISNEYNQKQYLYSRIITVLMSFVACIVYLSTASGYDYETKYAILIYLAYSNINVISDVMLGSLQIKGRLEVNGYSNIVRGVTCFVGFVVAHLLRNLVVSLCVMVITDLLVTLVYDTSLYKKLEGKIKLPDKSDVRAIYNILKCCFPLMLSTLFPIITAAVPRRKLQLLYGKEAVGIFSSIFNPTVLIITLAPALILAAIPVLTDYWNQNEKVLFFSTVCKCYLICISVTLIAELLALICGRPLMKLVFGNSILEYYNLLYWAIVATGINAMTSCGNAILISMRKKNVVVVASLLSMLCEFSCSEGLIRRYGIAGASHALLFAYAIQVFIQIGMMAYYIIRKNKED